MSSEKKTLVFKTGFGTFIALGAAAAGTGLASLLCLLAVSIGLGITAGLRNGIDVVPTAFTVALFTGGPAAAYFCFIYSFFPNFLGTLFLIQRSLKNQIGLLYASGKQFLLLGVAYGLLIFVLSVCLMGAHSSKGKVADLFITPLFLFVLPTAPLSGIWHFRITKGMLKNAIHQNDLGNGNGK